MEAYAQPVPSLATISLEPPSSLSSVLSIGSCGSSARRGENHYHLTDGGETRRRNAEINRQLANWAKQSGTGIVFDSNTEFRLPNRASRSPDASWVLKSRLEAIPEPEREKFPPICPDFVLELLSPSDNLEEAKLKDGGVHR